MVQHSGSFKVFLLFQMQRNDLAQHMQEFTQMHMRCMAEYLHRHSLTGYTQPPPSENRGAAAAEQGAQAGASSSGAPCQCCGELQTMRETTQQLEGRLVRQDHQLRELSIQVEQMQIHSFSFVMLNSLV